MKKKNDCRTKGQKFQEFKERKQLKLEAKRAARKKLREDQRIRNKKKWAARKGGVESRMKANGTVLKRPEDMPPRFKKSA